MGTWHARLAHVNFAALKANLKNSGIKVVGLAHQPCEACMREKAHKQPHRKVARELVGVGEVLAFDIQELPEVGLNGEQYNAVGLDLGSGMAWVFPIVHKSDAKAKVVEVLNEIKNHTGREARFLRVDGGGEFMMDDELKKRGIGLQDTARDSSSSNGRVERKHRTLVEGDRTMRATAGVGGEMWPYGMKTACHVQNRFPGVYGVSPYEAFYKRKVEINHLRVWGCKCFVLKMSFNKCEAPSIECALVGYGLHGKYYLCYDLETGRIIQSRDVTFAENVFPLSELRELEQGMARNDGEWIGSDSEESGDDELLGPVELAKDAAARMGDRRQTRSMHGTLVGPLESSVLRRPRQAAMTALEHVDDNPAHDRVLAACDISDDQLAFCNDDPTFAEAMAGPEREQWTAAMEKEFENLTLHGTWQEVDSSDARGQTAVDSKWVLKRKRDHAGRIVKYKARLCARGFRQVQGVDFDEVYAPTIHWSTIMYVLNLTLFRGWSMMQYDVDGAFLNAHLSHTIYLRLPRGFERPGKLLLLLRSIYGLRQASRAWYMMFRDLLLSIGWQRSAVDWCLFYFDDGSHYGVLLIHVDDIIMAGSDHVFLDGLLQRLQDKVTIRSEGVPEWYLGVHIVWSRELGTIELCQESFIDKLLIELDLDARSVSTPMDETARLSLDDCSQDDRDKEFMAGKDFRHVVGGLMFLANRTRPDILPAVNEVARYSAAPGPRHWVAVMRIVRYLKKTKTFVLAIEKPGVWALTGYSDSDWAGCRKDRKSTSGFVFFLGTSLISCASRKQDSVTLSSTEAEYVALSEASQETVHLQRLVEEFQGSLPLVNLFVDNQGALKWVEGGGEHRKAKHVDVRYHYVRELHEKKAMTFSWIKSKDNVADLFTKPLPRVLFEEHRKAIGIRPPRLRGSVGSGSKSIVESPKATPEHVSVRTCLEPSSSEGSSVFH